jgi:type II secretory ATPase GspE/PulE/Tfp pilus assembly ATPase PilB-like protein
VQVNFSIKPKPFDFALAMHCFLRADPDIIMVGEMRDGETAEIAVEASLTGHLVLSTLHTNSAPETVTRLTEMGIDPFNVADSLLGVLAQRLVRVLCEDCKEEYEPDESERKQLGGAEVGVIFRPAGCAKCDHTGYKGRTGIYELLVATDALKALITKHSPIAALREQAYKDGMTTMRMDGIRLVKESRTTLAEVNRVCIY